MDEACIDMDQQLRIKGNFKAELKQLKGKPKAKMELDLKKPFQNNLDDEGNQIDNSEVAFEDEVYLHEGKEDWAIKRPIKYGFFNLNNGVETL